MAADVTERVERSRSASCNFLLEQKKAFRKTSTDDRPERDTAGREKVILDKQGIFTRYIKGSDRSIRVKVLSQRPPKETVSSEPTKRRLQLPAKPAFYSYWVLPLLHTLSEPVGEETITKNLPLSLLWLLRTCAAVADTTPFSVYKELLVIEAALLMDGNEDGCSKESLRVMQNLKALY